MTSTVKKTSKRTNLSKAIDIARIWGAVAVTAIIVAGSVAETLQRALASVQDMKGMKKPDVS